jgi:hypothetical protein
MILARRHIGQPVARRRRGIHELAHSGRAGRFKNAHSALHVDVHIVRRPLDRGNDVTDAGQMEDGIGAGEDRRFRVNLADVGPVPGQPRILKVVREIALAPPGQIVDDPNLVAPIEQKIDQMASDKARAAGDDGNLRVTHAAFSFFSVRTL